MLLPWCQSNREIERLAFDKGAGRGSFFSGNHGYTIKNVVACHDLIKCHYSRRFNASPFNSSQSNPSKKELDVLTPSPPPTRL